MKIQSIKGTKDILYPEVLRWQRLEQISRELFALYGYKEIRTPVIEHTPLFVRSIGQTTDIVEKEMYTFQDKSEHSVSLRPEETAGVVRAYLENGLHMSEKFVKLYYIGPMFRRERPQKGRQRQFHQIGVEAIGSASPYLDAEVISLMVSIIEKAGISRYDLKLNSLGCSQDRKKFSNLLREKLKEEEKFLCEDCQQRIKKNILRVLDCKNEACRRIAQKLPTTLESLCQGCLEHFEDVKGALDTMGVKYTITPHLVRGLDYYTRTAFEVSCQGLGAQDAVAAGGRYDDLVQELGGPMTPAVGFSVGVERMMLAIEAAKVEETQKPLAELYIATIGTQAYKYAYKLMDELRKQKISCQMDYEEKSLKAQMRSADSLKASFVALLGEDELKKNTVTLKDMSTGQQKEVRIDELAGEIRKRKC